MRSTIFTICLAAALSAGLAQGQTDTAQLQQILRESPTWTNIDAEATAMFRAELAEQVNALLDDADPDTLTFMPATVQRGIGGYLNCFGNPAEVAAVLADVAPLLDEPLRQRALERAEALIERYPPWEVTWQHRGTDAAWNIRPPDLIPGDPDVDRVPLGNLYFLWQVTHATGQVDFVRENWGQISRLVGASVRDTGLVEVRTEDRYLIPDGVEPPYDRVRGRICVGLIEPGSLQMSIRVGPDRNQRIHFVDDGEGNLAAEDGSIGTIDYSSGAYDIQLTTPTTDKGFTIVCQAPVPLTYSDIAGLIGYARLAEMLGRPEAEFARDKAIEALARAADVGYNTMYQMAIRRYISGSNHDGEYAPLHNLRWGHTRKAVSTLWSDEIGRLLRQTQAQDVADHLHAYETLAVQSAWFQNHGLPGPDTVNGRPVDVPGGDGMGGENCNVGSAVGWTFYMLYAYVVEADRADLRMWIDVPWARAGDIQHIQRLAACIRAHGDRQYVAH